ncbi:MAG TPA: geranylgeranyl reductase family protein [Nocardioidaceae bacterium]|nr:geranylgeranyl reductase family protein [Nocardioidaceae bacterium]
MTWDLAVVGAGPAGAATAIGAMRADPSLRVVMLDRADFPRDKSCGDGIAPHVIDLLEDAGVTGIVDDQVPVPRLRLIRGGLSADRDMARPTFVVPRTVFDHRLVEAAQVAGAELVRHRVRTIDDTGPKLAVDDAFRARVVVGADGAHSVVRRALGIDPGPMAVALRGYAPVPAGREAAQVIVFDTTRRSAYAWSFDRGDGIANVGYGEILDHRSERPTKSRLLERLDALLPDAAAGGTDWRGHQLPLSSGSWRPVDGRILLAGDAAGLVNPMTGEGIYYAVATGLAAGRAAAEAIAAGEPDGAGARYRRQTGPMLDSHLRHIRVAARLCRSGAVIDAGLRSSAADQRVFDDLVELGLARGRITRTMVRGLARGLFGPAGGRSATHHGEETPKEL